MDGLNPCPISAPWEICLSQCQGLWLRFKVIVLRFGWVQGESSEGNVLPSLHMYTVCELTQESQDSYNPA